MNVAKAAKAFSLTGVTRDASLFENDLQIDKWFSVLRMCCFRWKLHHSTGSGGSCEGLHCVHRISDGGAAIPLASVPHRHA